MWRLGQVRDTRFDPDVSNEMLLLVEKKKRVTVMAVIGSNDHHDPLMLMYFSLTKWTRINFSNVFQFFLNFLKWDDICNNIYRVFLIRFFLKKQQSVVGECKVSELGVFSSPHFHAVAQNNKKIYRQNLVVQSKYGKTRTRKNSEIENFSHRQKIRFKVDVL